MNLLEVTQSNPKGQFASYSLETIQRGFCSSVVRNIEVVDDVSLDV